MNSNLSAKEFLDSICKKLADGGIDESRQEGRLIAETILGCDYAGILSGLAASPSREEITDTDFYIKQRLSGIPLAYILGFVDFYNHRFHIKPGVMVPRPETELLVQESLKILDKHIWPNPKVLDLYTGCGNVILLIATEYPGISGIAVDIDPVAIECAEKNHSDLKCESIEFRLCDVKEFVSESTEKFHLITANPPYIAESEFSSLQTEIRDHENPTALIGGKDGLDHFRILADILHGIIESDGYFLSEIGIGQKNSISAIFSPWSKIDFIPDLNGIPRVLIAQP